MNRTVRILTFLSVLGLLPAGADNLLKNGGFEEEGLQPFTARYWKMNDPDDHGDAWGNAIRIDWRSHEGSYIGVVRGSWAGMGEYGGFWQEVPVQPGQTCRVSAWFWADGTWNAEVQELKIEFWNTDRSVKLDESVVTLADIGEIWTLKEITAAAHDDAAWARVVINVENAGENGALQFDEAALTVDP